MCNEFERRKRRQEVNSRCRTRVCLRNKNCHRNHPADTCQSFRGCAESIRCVPKTVCRSIHHSARPETAAVATVEYFTRSALLQAQMNTKTSAAAADIRAEIPNARTVVTAAQFCKVSKRIRIQSAAVSYLKGP